MLPASIAPMVLTNVVPALAPLAKEIVTGYTTCLGKREEERTRRAAIEGETKCRVAAIETSGRIMEETVKSDGAINLQCAQEVASLLHQPEILSDPQKLSKAGDMLLTLQQAQHAQSRECFDKLSEMWRGCK